VRLLIRLLSIALLPILTNMACAQIKSLDLNYSVSLYSSGFSLPVDIVSRPAFNDLLITEEAGAIKRVDIKTGVASVFATFPADLTPYKGMYHFYGIGADSSGNVFAPASQNAPATSPILEFDSKGNPLTRLSFPGTAEGLTLDSMNNLYVISQPIGGASGGQLIYKYLPPYTSAPTLFAGGFGDLQTIAFNAAGDMYGADDDGTVYKITPGGMTASSHVAIATGVTEPFSIAIEPFTQDIFVGTRSTTIVRISLTTGILTTFATGFSPTSADAIAFDSGGNLYAADQFTGVTWRFTKVVAASATIAPDHGGNAGYVSLTITGKNFTDAALTDTLSCAGQADITGIAPQIISASEVIDTFNLQGASPNKCDVIVTQAGASPVTYPQSFTVQAGGVAQLAIDLVGASQVRAGLDTNFYLIVSNIGTIDAPFVSVQAQATAGSVSSAVSLRSARVSSNNANLMASIGFAGCSLPPTTIYLGAGTVQPIPINCTPQGNACYSLIGSTEQLGPSNDCAKERSDVDAAQAALDAADNNLLNGEQKLTSLQEESIKDGCGAAGETTVCVVLADQIASQEGEVSKLELEDDNAKRDLAIAQTQLRICENTNHLQPSSVKPLQMLVPEPPVALTLTPSDSSSSSLQFCSVSSLDPNAKVGVSGVGNAQYVRGALPLSYTLLFENLSTASASASQVVVTDVLDPNLDTSTLSISGVQFGATDIQLPPGLSSYTTTVDLTSTLDLLVNVSARLVANTLTVTFTSIDPLTGKPPTDLRGFLPQDINPPEGEGSVTFTIYPRSGLATNTQILNGANVFFDKNPPIQTKIWHNTVDNSAPVSAITTLSPSENSSAFPVSWSGTDLGSGLQDFTIYVSDNGGLFVPWFTNTTATSAIFTGQAGHTYGFYSLARDGVGNIEATKTSPDTSTQVPLPTAATPAFSVIPGTYISPQTVTISDTTIGATIYYTADGTAPSMNSTQYGGAITVSSSETLNAIAVASGYTQSAIAAASYTITPPTVMNGTVQLVTTAVLSKTAGGYQALVTVRNTGSGTASNVQLTAALLGTAGGGTLPIPLGNLAPGGGSAVGTLTFPVSAGVSGSVVLEKLTGTYSGGTFGGSFRATLP
jgi:uncharacterized repeat protein (TIGR01451 family)